MRAMNYAVDVEHKQVRDVAREFLEKTGLSPR
jgi:glycine betaine/choline ABC-type transport system substrate-binding protein